MAFYVIRVQFRETVRLIYLEEIASFANMQKLLLFF